MLTTKFETLRMQDSEIIDEFYAKLCNLSNQAFSIREEYKNSKLVRKVLRLLPKRLSIKVIVIVEAKDLENLKIDELIRSLQTFKLNLDKCKKVKFKGERSTALQVVDKVPIPNSFAIKELQE
ncbi:hypothetical protein Goarm_012900 [Gossypium armourianum]|uniref:Gag-pol polyprotein n=1 Tax=Gossypium armourianum TaxID=34283 RepID=A0A7J9J1A5_9ROSI|nr:hypothetical protein [Gossypium armourianum]